MKSRVRWLLIILVILFLLAVPGVLRVYSIGGPSDAPTLVMGDRVLVNRAAYDVVVPYVHARLFTWRHPRRGDLVILRLPDTADQVGTKRVVGVPGDRLEMRDHRLLVNGESLRYDRLEAVDFDWIPAENHLGPFVEMERGLGSDHLITHGDSGPAAASFDPVELGDDEYFVMGDNRGDSRDSRVFGPVERDQIQGRVLTVLIPAAGRP